VANGTDSGPKALPGSFSFPIRGLMRHEPEGKFVVSTGRRALREAGSAVGSRGGDIMACTVRDLPPGQP